MAIRKFRQHTLQIISVMNQSHREFTTYQCGKETVHDLRVSIRRLMPLIKVLIRLEDERQVVTRLKYHQQQCKNVLKALSAPRDLEVQIRLTSSLQQSRSWPKHAKQSYTDSLYEEKARLDKEIVPTVTAMNLPESTRFFSRKMKHFSCDKALFRETLHTLHTQLEEKLRQSVSELKKHNERFHQARIVLKKFRYHVELETAAGGHMTVRESMADQAGILKQIQDHLGDTHDLSVALMMMKARKVDRSVVRHVETLYQRHLIRSVDYLLSREALLWK